MITIDGSHGEGGGQILRSSLSLSLALGRPLSMVNIRANRKPGGLRPQHVACVKAAAAISGAKVRGAEVNSARLVLEPGTCRGGEYRFDVGTAGSATLVLQTVLVPLLLCAKEPSQLTLIGGTHNPFAPPYEFLERVYVPLLRKMGADISVTLHQRGFYPAGGGHITAEITPSKLARLELLERGALVRRAIVAGVANIPASIAEREARTMQARLGWDQEDVSIETFEARGGGNAAFAELVFENASAVFSGIGERGVRAEKIGENIAKETQRYLDAGVPVDEHLADQLMMPMVLGSGGTYRTTPLSLHARTQVDLLEQWCGVRIEVTAEGEDVVKVSVPPLRA